MAKGGEKNTRDIERPGKNSRFRKLAKNQGAAVASLQRKKIYNKSHAVLFESRPTEASSPVLLAQSERVHESAEELPSGRTQQRQHCAAPGTSSEALIFHRSKKDETAAAPLWASDNAIAAVSVMHERAKGNEMQIV